MPTRRSLGAATGALLILSVLYRSLTASFDATWTSGSGRAPNQHVVVSLGERNDPQPPAAQPSEDLVALPAMTHAQQSSTQARTKREIRLCAPSLEQPLVDAAAASNAHRVVFATFANHAQLDFALNWIAHLDALDLAQSALVGATDDATACM